MSDTVRAYTVVDPDNDNEETTIEVVRRVCCCSSPGCVDDELRIYEDGPAEAPLRLQVPRLMMPYIEGLLSKEMYTKD